MSGIVRNLAGSAAKLTGLFGRNFLYSSKQSYSTCWNCLKLGNVSTRFITPAGNSYVRFNLYSTQNDTSELLKYLDEEIAAEEESRNKLKPIPSKLGGFEVHLNGSEISLIKETPQERIEVRTNVNLSAKDVAYSSEEDQEIEESKFISKPPFGIEIKRGDTVLRLFCTYENDDPDDTPSESTFIIEDIAIYKGEWDERNYTADGSILDEGVYEMLFQVLDEKGINDEFVMELSEICTSYEHASYVGLLRDLKRFVS